MIRASRIEKSYGQLQILKGLDFEVVQGEAVCILGASGAGKSTFLHILGTLDRPTRGTVTFAGEDLFAKNDAELSAFRSQKLGFVFQFHHLLSEFTAIENAMMPGRIVGQSVSDSRARAAALLDYLGLSHRLEHYPSELSGGEQQRVAIARALFHKPAVLLADEPTGNLDSENSQKIQDLFFRLKEEMGLTLVVVTHDQRFAQRFPRSVKMADGHWVF
ncbi:MAG TPA: ABC transporter ATP-binding protein [Bdellovibrionales bacterium]|nr:ABC transporter ATP-binding protein [Bdellovibrionales bacterium]